MDQYRWKSFLFAPLSLTDDVLARLNDSEIWLPWQERFSTEDSDVIEDMRRFLISPVREKFFPLCGSPECARKSLDVNALDGAFPIFAGKKGCSVSIAWIDLLVLDTFSLLIIKLATEENIDLEQLYDLNRRVPSWFMRYPGDDITYWDTGCMGKTDLKTWIEVELLGLSDFEKKKVFGDTDWFGHSLPMVSLVSVPRVSSVIADNDFINLLVGAPFENESYALCSSEQERLIRENVFQVYKNWLVGDLNNRILFYEVNNEKSPLNKNLEKHYIYIASIVFYQKIMLTYFLEAFLEKRGKKESKTKTVRNHILRFRKKYFLNKLTTYSLGENLYQFFMKTDGINYIIDRVTTEIESNDDFERLQLERRENSVLNFIAVFAAITLPVTTVGTIYGVKDEYIFQFSSFWKLSLSLTALFFAAILIMHFLLRKNVKI